MNIKQHITVVMCLLLSACGGSDGFRETLGLNRKGPDEFQVLSRPPLTVPPEFNLRPPKQGAEYTPGVSATDQAHNRVLGADNNSAPAAATAVPIVTSGALPSNSDSQFLANAGAEKANHNIKQVISDERQNGVLKKDDNFLFGASKEKDLLVDPAKEAERLKDDKAKSLPPTAGETPVIAPQSKGIIGDLF